MKLKPHLIASICITMVALCATLTASAQERKTAAPARAVTKSTTNARTASGWRWLCPWCGRSLSECRGHGFGGGLHGKLEDRGIPPKATSGSVNKSTITKAKPVTASRQRNERK